MADLIALLMWWDVTLLLMQLQEKLTDTLIDLWLLFKGGGASRQHLLSEKENSQVEATFKFGSPDTRKVAFEKKLGQESLKSHQMKEESQVTPLAPWGQAPQKY